MNGPDLRLKVVEGKARVKQLDELIATLQEKKKRIVDWLAKHKNVQIDLPAGPIAMTELDYTDEFEDIWKYYPERNGRKLEKKAAFRKFKSLKALDRSSVKTAVLNYRKSPEVKRGIVRDMVRFLKPDFWPAWVTPSEAMMIDERTFKNETKSKASSTIDEIVKNA